MGTRDEELKWGALGLPGGGSMLGLEVGAVYSQEESWEKGSP